MWLKIHNFEWIIGFSAVDLLMTTFVRAKVMRKCRNILSWPLAWTTSYFDTFCIVDHFILYCECHMDHIVWSLHTKEWILNRPSYWKPKNTVLAGRLLKFWIKRFSKLWFYQSFNSNKVWVFLFSELKIYGLFAQNKRSSKFENKRSASENLRSLSKNIRSFPNSKEPYRWLKIYGP